MKNTQLTHDAAYKFTLWQHLYYERQRAALATQKRVGESDAEPVPCDPDHRVASAIERTVMPMIRRHLPRREYQPCCLAGVCMRTPGNNVQLHRFVCMSRKTISIVDLPTVRDEDCFCLAHACSCIGSPVRLSIANYRSSPSDMRDPFRGLRCILQHLHLEHVEFSSISSAVDGRELARELARLLGRTQAERLQYPPAIQDGAAPPGTVLRRLSLVHVPVPSQSMSALLAAASRCDSLTHLSLHNCSLESLASVSAYVVATCQLSHLSIRTGTHDLPGPQWASLAAAIAQAPSIISWDAGDCGWGDDILMMVLESLRDFTPRHEGKALFQWRISRNPLSDRYASLLGAAPLSFSAAVERLYLNELPLPSDDAFTALMEAFPTLSGVDLGGCAVPAGSVAVQRVVRSLCRGEHGPSWQYLSMRHWTMPVSLLKRVMQLPFSPDSQLILQGVSMRDSLAKCGMSSCIGHLSTLDLSECDIVDDGIMALASALEKCAPLLLRTLKLASNGIGSDKKKAERCFPHLCRALRASSAPHVEVLDLSRNRLPVRPLVSFVEQVSCTLRELQLSHTSIADDSQERVLLWASVMRRQRGAAPAPGAGLFAYLDVHTASHTTDAVAGAKEVTEWLATQTAVRFFNFVVHMFGRRVFGSVPIPRAMYASLHISSQAQAARLLPSLIPLAPAVTVSSSLLARTIQGTCDRSVTSECVEMDPVLLKSLIESVSPMQMGYLRLLELWGITRTSVVNKLLCQSA